MVYIFGLINEHAHFFQFEKFYQDILIVLYPLKVKVTQSCLTLCNPLDYTVRGILQARILEWVAFPFSRGILPTQGSKPGLPHCRRILYQLSYQGYVFIKLNHFAVQQKLIQCTSTVLQFKKKRKNKPRGKLTP